MTSLRKPRTKRAIDPSGVKARIREAEKKSAPVGRETVGIDADGYEMIAVLIERGLGKKVDVLRKALALGLLTLNNQTAPILDEVNYGDTTQWDERAYHLAKLATDEMVTEVSPGALPEQIPLGAAITVPPSQERRMQTGEDQ